MAVTKSTYIAFLFSELLGSGRINDEQLELEFYDMDLAYCESGVFSSAILNKQIVLVQVKADWAIEKVEDDIDKLAKMKARYLSDEYCQDQPQCIYCPVELQSPKD